MRRTGWAAAMVVGTVTAAAAAAEAQTGTPAGQARSITLVGCVQPGDPAGAPSGAAGGSASSGSRADPASAAPNATSFVLANAAPPGGAARSTGTAGRTGGATGAAAATPAPTYVLDGGNVAAHVGHMVEITGTLDSATAPPGGRPAGEFGSGAPSTAAPSNTGAPREVSSSDTASTAPRLRVTALKMVAATCPQP